MVPVDCRAAPTYAVVPIILDDEGQLLIRYDAVAVLCFDIRIRPDLQFQQRRCNQRRHNNLSASGRNGGAEGAGRCPNHKTRTQIPVVRVHERQRLSRGLKYESRLFDRRVRRSGANILFQCGLATLALMVILMSLDLLTENLVVVVAIASTVFIVFIMPRSRAAGPRRVLGGHAIALGIGTVFFLLHLTDFVGGGLYSRTHLGVDALGAVAMGLCILLMVLTRMEHPPAAGTALGLVMEDWTWSAVLFVVIGAIALSAVHIALRRRMVDLF